MARPLISLRRILQETYEEELQDREPWIDEPCYCCAPRAPDCGPEGPALLPVWPDDWRGPVEAELLRRRARFRALGALGLPIEGEWEYEECWLGYWLSLSCRACGAFARGRLYLQEPRGLARREEELLAELAQRCPHAARAEELDPEQVEILTALELVSWQEPPAP